MGGRVPINATKMEDIKKIGKKGKEAFAKPTGEDINAPAPEPVKKEGPAKRNSAQGQSSGKGEGQGWF